jgi:Fe2+ or Zn2+ uptake regulation protein
VEPIRILESLFDKKTLAVLKFLSANPDKQFYLREISRGTRVPIATVYRIINRLVPLGVIDMVKIKRMKLYTYNQGKEGKFVEQLIEVRKGAVEEFIEACRAIPEIGQVILHGRKQKDRANFLIIGENVPTTPLVEAQGRIKETMQFTVIYLVLGPHQYEQMVEMGLYAGERQVLFQRL